MLKSKKLKNSKFFKAYQVNEFYKIDNSSNFIKLLRTITESKGGIGSLSKLTKTRRESLYAILSETGRCSPRLDTIIDITNALNLELIVKVKS